MDNMVDDKNMSLDDLIKRDKMKKKASHQGKGKPPGIRNKLQKLAPGKMQSVRGGRFGAKDFRGQKDRSFQKHMGQRDRLPLQAKRTGNMIMKRR